MALLGLCACERQLEDGVYDFVATEVTQDSCRAMPRSAPLDIWDGRVHVRGDTILVDYDLHGAKNERALVGRFLEDADVEQFIADATFDVDTEMSQPVTTTEPGTVPPPPPDCRAFAHLHLHGFVDGPRAFHGQLRVDYTRRPDADPSCLPGCVLDLVFDAELVEDAAVLPSEG